MRGGQSTATTATTSTSTGADHHHQQQQPIPIPAQIQGRCNSNIDQQQQQPSERTRLLPDQHQQLQPSGSNGGGPPKVYSYSKLPTNTTTAASTAINASFTNSFLRHDHESNNRDFSNSYVDKLKGVYETYKPLINPFTWNKDSWRLFLLVIVLVTATITERLTFKVAADRLTAYRLVLQIFILFASILVFSLVTFLKRGFTNVITEKMREFPHSKMFYMAVLDVMQFTGLIVACSGVPPTMTVLLLHASTPMLVYGTRYLFPDRKYSAIQLKGTTFITLAIIISVSRPILWMFTKIDYSCAVSSLFFVSAAAFQGIANLYKEKCIIDWSKPIDMYFLNSWIFIYQILIAICISPFTYLLQIITSESRGLGFPLEEFPRNVIDGYKCIMGQDPYPYWHEVHGSYVIGRHGVRTPQYDITYTECDHWNLKLVVLYVISNVIIFECVHRILQTHNHHLGKVMSLALVSSFIALGLYDSEMDYGVGIFGTTIGLADVTSLVVLLYGLDIYGRDPEPDVEIITDYVSNAS